MLCTACIQLPETRGDNIFQILRRWTLTVNWLTYGTSCGCIFDNNWKMMGITILQNQKLSLLEYVFDGSRLTISIFYNNQFAVI